MARAVRLLCASATVVGSAVEVSRRIEPEAAGPGRRPDAAQSTRVEYFFFPNAAWLRRRNEFKDGAAAGSVAGRSGGAPGGCRSIKGAGGGTQEAGGGG